MSFQLTVDKSKAIPGQSVFVQIFVSVLSVPLLLKSPPAHHSSAEHQVVTVASATKTLFSLQLTGAQMIEQLVRYISDLTHHFKNCMDQFKMGVEISHLVD